ncbi:MAG TPA: ABC transporter permease [Gaiellaceae bacterium]|nr:ABC transporter permease [Gaiellaceae bacterium]
MSRLRRQAEQWVPAAVVFVSGIALWEAGVRGLDVQNFLLPPPSDIAETLWSDRRELWSASFFTFREALGGYVVGCSLGFLAALVVSRWRRLQAAVMPYAIAAGAIPIIAFAPITNNWFGVTGMASKMAIVAVLCFFPMMVNAARGLTSVRPSSIELMRSYAASELTVFRRVRLPHALPYVFQGLKVGTVLAMIGAIVGDYFGGAPGALGVEIRRWVGIFAFEQAWAGIVLASALGIVFYAAVALVERRTMAWHPSVRGARAE